MIDDNLTDIPTVTFSQLRIKDWKLSWSPPENCSKISGPLRVARIEIRGISNNVKNFNVVIHINKGSINLYEELYGAERYLAKIFALREHGHKINTSVYEKYEFETPSKGETLNINTFRRLSHAASVNIISFLNNRTAYGKRSGSDRG